MDGATALKQDFTITNTTLTSIDSVWLKVSGTYTRGSGGPQPIACRYDTGAGFTTFATLSVKSSAYAQDSIKFTSPTVTQVDALQVQSEAELAAPTEQFRITWWGITVYGTAAAEGKARIMRTVIKW